MKKVGKIGAVVFTLVLFFGTYSLYGMTVFSKTIEENPKGIQNSIEKSTSEQVIEMNPETFFDGDLRDSEELFAGYVQQKMYDGRNKGIALFRNLGERKLTGINKTLYDKLKEQISQVADGIRPNTVFEISVSDLGIDTTWTADELGISTREQIETAVNNKLSEWGYDSNLLLDCLMTDCPYDLYWYDKTKGTSISKGSLSCQFSGETVTNVTLQGPFTFSLCVAKDYQDTDNMYAVDTNKTSATTTAVENAKQIVEENQEKSDYDKLVAYKEKICNLVSYNYDVAENDSTPYGDPWQIIWVFDENSSTNVVCEGYAKAFQYLCDLTAFDHTNMSCYTVTGTMNGGTGADSHMWNLMTMEDEKQYLVDVTNCDEGTIGAPNQLFLVGLDGSWNTDYHFIKGNRSVCYTYDKDTIILFGEKLLTLSSSNYVQSSSDVTVPTQGTSEMSNPEITNPVVTEREQSSPSGGTKQENNSVVTKAVSLSNGAVFSKGVLRYRVTNPAKKQVQVIGIQKKATKQITIPAKVTATSTGETFSVVSIAKAAFKKNKKIKKVTIGTSVKTIGKRAFFQCKNLKTIVIKTKNLKMHSVGAKAFQGISSKSIVKIPKQKRNLYRKILRAKGIGMEVSFR